MGTTCNPHEKKNLDPELTPFTKMTSRQIIDLNIKCKTIKLIEVNKGDITDDLWYGNDFLDDTKDMIFERNN